MKKSLVYLSFSKFLPIFTFLFLLFSCENQKIEQTNKEFNDFITDYDAKVIPLEKEYNLASYYASISGKEEDYRKATTLEILLINLYSNEESFKKLKKIKESGYITDELLKRQLNVIYNKYLKNQIEERNMLELIMLNNDVEREFSTYRPRYRNQEITVNKIEEILKSSTDSEELKEVWIASKDVGNIIADDFIKLVKLRNKIATNLGFKNFFEMSLILNDQDPKEIEELFDELDILTEGPYTQLKDEMDGYLAKKYHVRKENLMPWHYQNRFFQTAPKIYEINLDEYYEKKDIVYLAKNFYKNIGIDIDNIVENSDLYEKPGKIQQSDCRVIERGKDVRVLCNVELNYYWMNTVLYEFGFAGYNKYIGDSLPYVLKTPAHFFTNDAIATLFSRFSSNPLWMKDVVKISDEEYNKIREASCNNLRLEKFIFSRFAQVMYRFEKRMYENPDQALNKLWWDLVQKYQLLKRPARRNSPDWATKSHFIFQPCSYHNYLLGELLASQLHYYIVENIIKSDDYKNQSYVNNKEIGKYLIKNIFEPGNKYYWNDLIEKATGEKLSAQYFSTQFIN